MHSNTGTSLSVRRSHPSCRRQASSLYSGRECQVLWQKGKKGAGSHILQGVGLDLTDKVRSECGLEGGE